jgi:hypothetical protein
MNLKTSPLKPLASAIAGAVWLSATVISAAAQPTGGTDFTPYQLIGQRNIFDPNRVPHVRSSSAHATARVVDSFSFVGTMSYAKGTFAFFDGTSPDFRKVLELGGSVADFNVAAITPKAVTLLAGTNETILPLGAQMRRDDDGHWVMSTDPAAYAGTGNASTSGSSRHPHSPSDNSNTTVPDGATDSGTDTVAPDTSSPPAGVANDALTRLMQQRAQEEQQLGQGSGQ